ncbi:hypothetical protein P9239_01370 [Caballeronia sp. LZ062]|uniref:hypothetical protein n=1 Tax=unclassified Caballeronia TaxID=2646786 RepID=UPI00285A480D|nr:MULTISPECIES: hypothetical protein [unclassified Caballeronia]MDR5857457.1 hypothetical protein [Caballeronia sp. LZ050]MDR5869008.1 hypothetical protein [Caballeronia sp. LZ062]
MTTLTIHDLVHHAELGRQEMSAVRGGTSFYFPSYKSSFDLSATTQQLTNQAQNTLNENGVNDAFAHKITSDVAPHQKADNTNHINVFGPYAM